MNVFFELVDSEGNHKEVDLFSFLKSVNENIEFKDDETIVFHLSRPTPLAADVCPLCEGSRVRKYKSGWGMCRRCKGTGHAAKA